MNELKKIALWTLAGAVGVFIGVVGGWWYISRYMVVRTAVNAPQCVVLSYSERRELENLAGADVDLCGELVRR